MENCNQRQEKIAKPTQWKWVPFLFFILGLKYHNISYLYTNLFGF
jgi:hypothetical protein